MGEYFPPALKPLSKLPSSGLNQVPSKLFPKYYNYAASSSVAEGRARQILGRPSRCSSNEQQLSGILWRAGPHVSLSCFWGAHQQQLCRLSAASLIWSANHAVRLKPFLFSSFHHYFSSFRFQVSAVETGPSLTGQLTVITLKLTHSFRDSWIKAGVKCSEEGGLTSPHWEDVNQHERPRELQHGTPSPSTSQSDGLYINHRPGYSSILLLRRPDPI